MARPYSVDLRARIVRAVEAGMSWRAAAAKFEVSVSFVVKLTREPGMSVAAVARQHGLSESLLDNWRSRVERGELVDPAGAVDTGFVPVAVMDARAMAPVPPWQAPTVPSPAMIEIELPNGYRLRVSERVALSTLRRLIGVLGPYPGHADAGQREPDHLALAPVDMRKGFDGLARRCSRRCGALSVPQPAGRSPEGAMVGWQRTVPVRQAAGTWPVRLAFGQGGRDHPHERPAGHVGRGARLASRHHLR